MDAQTSVFVPPRSAGFTYQFVDRNRRLIRLVQQSPILYDPRHPDNRCVPKKNAVWEEIAKEFNTTAQMCRTRFKTMRDCYMRERRVKYLNNVLNNSLVHKPRRNEDERRYFHYFSFLDNIAKPRIEKAEGKAPYKSWPKTNEAKNNFQPKVVPSEINDDCVILLDSSSDESLVSPDAVDIEEVEEVDIPPMPPLRMAPAAFLYAEGTPHCGPSVLTAQGFEVSSEPFPVFKGSSVDLLKYANNVLNSITDDASSLRAKTKIFETLRAIEKENLPKEQFSFFPRNK